MSEINPLSKLKHSVIYMSFADTRNLYQAYMPFVEGCGLFYATEEQYTLKQEVFIFLTLPEKMGKFAVSGRIVWINPPKKAVKRIPGVGIQLRSREAPKIREVIEAGLVKMIKSGLPTATM